MTDSRIIYVTGMKPKPPPEIHRRELIRVLDAAITRSNAALAGRLGARPEAFELVSWTSLIYPEPRDIGLDLPGIADLESSPVADRADRREIDAPARRLMRLWHLFGDSSRLVTRFAANRALRITLAEVRRYLDDHDGIAGRIRHLLREPLLDAWRAGDRILLIGHSFGSVIAYDTLWELSRRDGNPGRVDLLTLGSPIASRYIRMKLAGSDRPPPERYPANIRRWINVASRGELVALHPRIEPFFRRMVGLGLVESIRDVEFYNHFRGDRGLDVHKSYGYLHSDTVAGIVANWLEEGDREPG